MSSTENITEIIVRCLNGEASADLHNMLQQWLEEDLSHRTEFDDLKLLWDQTGNLTSIPFDHEKAWQKVHDRIATRIQAPVIRLFPWRKAILVAASFLILGSAYYFYIRNQKIEWKEYTAIHSNESYVLPDGSMFTLRQGSNLRIPDNYGIDSRMVHLTGEGYFEVHHDEKKPFYLSTAKSRIMDIGTEFLMESNDSEELVMVTEGKVSFSEISSSKYQIIVQKGQAAILNSQRPELKTIESRNLLAWKTNKLAFDNTSLAQVAKDLNDYYKVDFKFSNELNPNQILITAQFDNEPLSKVIGELNLFTGLNFRNHGDVIFVTK